MFITFKRKEPFVIMSWNSFPSCSNFFWPPLQLHRLNYIGTVMHLPRDLREEHFQTGSQVNELTILENFKILRKLERGILIPLGFLLCHREQLSLKVHSREKTL